MIKIGIDLDNTIISYDDLIYSLAKKKFPKIEYLSKNKSKDFIKKQIIKYYNNAEWTKLQSIIYGKKILKAKLFKNLIHSLKKLSRLYDIYIISHKTRYSKKGEKINLIDSAKKFLGRKKISFCENPLIKKEYVYFTETKKEKINLIKKLDIDIFVDDLKEILDLLNNDVQKIHFSNNRSMYKNFSKWKTLCNYLVNNYKKLLEEKIETIIVKRINIKKKLNYGTNNEVYLIKIKNKNYVLKIYKNLKTNLSFSKELKFLKVTQNSTRTPNIFYYNKKFQIIIMDYIEGKKINKISKNDIYEITNFIRDIQVKLNNYKSLNNKKIRNATDRIYSIFDIFIDIEKRIDLTSQELKNQNMTDVIKINNAIIKIYKSLKNKITKNNYKINQKKFTCLSPSDFNLRNMIKNKKGIYFIDFEYAGIDNCFKLMLDFFSQQGLKINKQQIILFLKLLNGLFYKMKDEFDDELITLNNIKWFYIILNSKFKNSYNKRQIRLAVNYFVERIEGDY